MPARHALATAVAAAVAASLATPAARAGAQDTRTVVEPTVPSACATLPARLVPVGDSTLAESDERARDDARIQAAIDECLPGRAVVLRADGDRRAFLSGPLRLRAGVTLVVDSGAVLFASRDPRVFDATPGACGVLADGPRGCRPLILVERAAHAGVMGPGVIDGRGWATLLGGTESWWDLAQRARTGPSQQNPRLIQATRADDFTLYRVTLRNSPQFHVVFDRGDGFTAWGVVIHTPSPRARNTDGIDPASARNVTITRSSILTGDDNVAIKGGGGGATRNVTVSHSRFYRGHGMSIGSETDGGVSDVLVTDLTIDGADNGLRIKSNASRGGLVERVRYEDVCIRATKAPLVFETHYTASAETTGTKIPVYRDVTLKDVRILGGGRLSFDGFDAARRLGLRLENVTADDPARLELAAAGHADVVVAGPTNLPLAGEDVRVTRADAAPAADAARSASSPAAACDGRFAPAPRTAAGWSIVLPRDTTSDARDRRRAAGDAAQDEARAAARAGERRGTTVATREEWQGQRVERVEELFQGRFPGVQVTVHPGQGVSVRIRGAGTLIGSGEPLYVIDGMQVEAGPTGLLALNPYDVERIEVLKEPAQTAEYGVRGANGVIRISTRRGGR